MSKVCKQISSLKVQSQIPEDKWFGVILGIIVSGRLIMFSGQFHILFAWLYFYAFK
jgi:hypothetical protein